MIKALTGNEVTYRQVWIDENGNMGSFSISEPSEAQKKWDAQRKEGEKKAFEERLENIREKSKEKAEEAKKKDEKMLLEKLENADNGIIYFDNNDMQILINAAKKETQEQPDQGKNLIAAGSNFDMQI